MATGGQKRTRLERVAALEMPPGQWARIVASLLQRRVVVRIFAALLAAVTLTVATRGWNPPFAYQTGYTPPFDIVATVPFSKPNQGRTENAQDHACSLVRYIYIQNPEPLVEMRGLLLNTIVKLTAAKRFADISPKQWQEFLPPPTEEEQPLTPAQREEQFLQFRQALAGPEKLEKFKTALAAAFEPFERHGILLKLPCDPGKGNYEEILVHPVGKPDATQIVKISDVLAENQKAVYQALLSHLDSAEVADRVFNWLQPRLQETETLTLDDARTKKALDEAAASVGVILDRYAAGHTLAPAGKPLDRRHVYLLRLEYEAAMASRVVHDKLARAAATTALIFLLLVMSGFYMRYRKSAAIAHLQSVFILLGMAVLTAILSYVASVDGWRAEIIPLLLFGISTAVAYGQELALLVSLAMAAIVALCIGLGLGEFFVLVGVSITTILQVSQIRSRAKLIYVGLFAGLVAVLLNIIAFVLNNQPLEGPTLLIMLLDAARLGLWVLAAGFLMTGLLPFIESLFGVLTDLSLLELGDVAHPLLQELIRRAPATYNHSITVGSIAEAASEAIGARGLLVRVGAYFHDIGKMLKPGYFIENQARDLNLHESLVPAMSTLVIIAHIKDGADLGRQRHLPKPIIDLIEQHHGTTLVEFFFGRAHEQKEHDPNGGQVEEAAYRYPGPKPQTKEAGVLMLADAVEGASRALVDPTPARLESLVREMAERRLHDGQFDESGLTLRELRTIEKSLVKSLTAIYHGRIKYPEQRTA
jgi:putative nucleotidyltransferase with HDIG domain